mgnify:CR=1 FL=1
MKWILIFFLFIILTILTQIGGLILLLTILIGRILFQHRLSKYPAFKTTILFLVLYLVFTFLIVPPIAQLFGRSPLPVFKNSTLKPASFCSYLFNRHYVKNELSAALEVIGNEFHYQYPEYHVLYLDANFPFFDGFPLLPHLSHNDGKKVDMAFYYLVKDKPLVNDVPTLTGYGYFINPQKGEFNQTEKCISSGNWQYDFTGSLVFQDQNKYQLDEPKTKYLLELIAKNPKIGKVFLEPHLKNRLGFAEANKIRFQGCHSVRHDDHIHIQL